MEIRNISKSFGSTQALQDVSLTCPPGRVHAIVGENGSGKSTLMKILAGVHRADNGSILIDNVPCTIQSTEDAERHGIGIVYQELSLFPHLSGYANIMIGREPKRGVFIDQSAIRRQCQAIIEELGFGWMNLNIPVRHLSSAEQQIIEVAKSLAKNPQILILDEPTAALTIKETDLLFQVIARLRQQGLTILFISHHLEEVFHIADDVTVLRDGQVVLSEPVARVTQGDIIHAMIGRQLEEFYPPRRKSPGPARLELREVMGARVGPINLTLREGEILGIGGVIGSGQTELVEMIAGVRPLTRGTMWLNGSMVSWRSIDHAIRAGIRYVPEDRKTEGLLLNMSVRSNLTLPLLSTQSRQMVRAAGFIRFAQEDRYSHEMRRLMNIKTEHLRTPVAALSGGNQQKVAVARWTDIPGRILILNDPTKGIDVGSKVDIYKAINRLADQGQSVVLVSSYNPELIGMCDRIVMMSHGRIVKEIEKADASEEALLAASSLR